MRLPRMPPTRNGRASKTGLALHRVRLLLGNIADHRQLVHLALIRLHEQDNPEYEASKANQQVQGESDQSQKGHEGEYRKSNVQNKEYPSEKQALPRVE